jgi:spermidine/putrescine ABC transporter ATP-binding subunit
MVSITIQNLTKRFGDVTALNDISFTIESGELFFLLGPSGCGKTTLLRHIAGFYTPDEGQVLFDGEDVTRTPPHKRNTAMMFQSYALWPHMTVAKNVAFGLEERKVAKAEIAERVDKALSTVKMGDYAERKINQLSGGQQQRVALARALIVRPKCLMLDEPLSNLDAKLRLEMRSEIRRICKEFGLTAVYVTHDQKEALSIADRMAILDAGTVAQIGTPLEVYRSPRTAVVADFIGETNFLKGTVEEADLDGHWEVETNHGRFAGRVADQDWKPKPGDKSILSVRPEALSLADTRPELNSIAGRVVESTYLGEIAQYVLQPEDGEPIRISELNPDKPRPPGERNVYATADPDDVVLIRAEK